MGWALHPGGREMRLGFRGKRRLARGGAESALGRARRVIPGFKVEGEGLEWIPGLGWEYGEP